MTVSVLPCVRRHEELIQWEKAPYARRAHPTPDHFLPLLVALGASGEQSKGKLVYDNYSMGLSLASFEFQQAVAWVALSLLMAQPCIHWLIIEVVVVIKVPFGGHVQVLRATHRRCNLHWSIFEQFGLCIEFSIMENCTIASFPTESRCCWMLVTSWSQWPRNDTGKQQRKGDM